LQPSRYSMLQKMRDLETESDIGGDDLLLRSWWLASSAYTWGTLRDFRRAHEGISSAHAPAADDEGKWACEAEVLGMADRWQESLACAERAWQIDPGGQSAAKALAYSLLLLGRIDEAAHRIGAIAQDSQSYEVVHVACWYWCALAESQE